MGVSTTGFVLTEKKDVFSVLSVIESTLIDLVKKYSSGDFIWLDETSKFPEIDCNSNSKYFVVNYKDFL